MSQIKDIFFIKTILDRATAGSHNGETGYYSVSDNMFSEGHSCYCDNGNDYYSDLKGIFDCSSTLSGTNWSSSDQHEFDSGHYSMTVVKMAANNYLSILVGGQNVSLNYDGNYYYTQNYYSNYGGTWFRWDYINGELTYVKTYFGGSYATIDENVETTLYSSMPIMMYYNNADRNINYARIAGDQGVGSGGWQVPNPNPTRKIVLNGVDYSESITPEPVNIERINYTNTDHSMGGDGTNVTFSDASSNSTADNFFLDLKSYRFSGSQSQVWNSTTSIRTYDGSTKKVWLNWGTQSGSSQQNFDIVEVSDPTRVQVLRDWETITQGGIIEIDIPLGANLTADDVILDFKNVYTYESLNGGSWNSITRDIQNNKIVITIPNYFATNSHFDLRVLAVIPRPSHTIKLNGATPLKIMLNGVCYFEKQSGGGYLYNWDLTSSTVDPVSGQSLQYYLNSNNEITADVQTKASLYTSGTGVTFSDQSDVNGIVLPVNLYTPGNVLEVDFTNFQVTYTMMEWGQTMVETHKCQGSYDTDYGIHWGVGGDYSNWFLTSNYDLGSGNTSYGYCDITNSTQAQLFANSTLKIKVISSANNRTQWEIYKDDTLLATTPELNNSSTYPFMLASASDTDNLFMLSPNYLNATVTGIRIYQE